MTSSARRPTEPVTDSADVRRHHHVVASRWRRASEKRACTPTRSRIELANRLRIMEEGGVHQAR
jgi:hypothetical protein